MASVLIADNDRAVNGLLSEVLARFGVPVRQVFDGRAAVDAARDPEVAVLVCDLDMPGATGFEVLESLRDLALHRARSSSRATSTPPRANGSWRCRSCARCSASRSTCWRSPNACARCWLPPATATGVGRKSGPVSASFCGRPKKCPEPTLNCGGASVSSFGLSTAASPLA